MRKKRWREFVSSYLISEGPVSFARRVLESVAFYFAESPRATAALLDEIERATEAIGHSPYLYPIYADEVRVRQLDRFPFSIFYRIDNGEAVIQSVAHNSRRPDYWRAR